VGISQSRPKVLVVGSGGREHAIVHALSRSPRRPRLLCFPGNPGIRELAEPLVVFIETSEGIAGAARTAGVELVIVGPEAYLADGLVDACQEAGLAAFGPTRSAARIETSKAWAKEIMGRAGVPTATYHRFTDILPLDLYLRAQEGALVVKADGMAAGKGVLVTSDRDDAARFAAQYLKPGSAVIVEEKLEGEEISLFALVSGEDVLPLGCARDYKRAYDGDTGPNTGGMGAISPPDVPPGFLEQMTESLVRPVARELVRAGHPFSGVLYAGLMLTDRGPYVLEFNARFGDPETQVLLPRLATDLLDLVEATAAGLLAQHRVELRETHTCGVTVASGGYPTSTRNPEPVSIGELPPDTVLYHAGTRTSDHGVLEANGGRVFTAVGSGESREQARERAYSLAREVQFEGAWYRHDIGA
jgi:phosphoribosylamine--glycine ligase